MPERGARLARREERACREYVSDEQRRQTGCPARQMSAYFGLGTLGRREQLLEFFRVHRARQGVLPFDEPLLDEMRQ